MHLSKLRANIFAALVIVGWNLVSEVSASEIHHNNLFMENQEKLHFVQEFHVEAQDLEAALLFVSRKIDIDIVVPSKYLKGRRSEEIVGIYSAEQVFTRLLSDSDLSFKLGESGSLIVFRQHKQQLAHVEIKEDDVEPVVEEVVVRGLRSSLQSSLERKKNSDLISDHIVAKRLGEFPDANLAEAIQRAPGVSVSRTIGGEAQFVSIRGLGPEYNTVLINGRELPSDENTRDFSFDIFSSGLFNSVEVYKSSDARLKEGGVGGVINLSTFSALSLENQSRFSIGRVYDGNSERWGNHYSIFSNQSFKDETLGFSFGAIRTTRYWRADMGQSLGRESLGVDQNNDGVVDWDTENFQIPGIWSYAHKSGKRDRLSAFANLEWDLSDNFKTSLDSVYALYKTPEFGVYQNANFNVGRDIIVDEIEGDAIVAFRMTDVPYEFAIDPKNRKVKFYQVGWKNSWVASNNFHIESDFSVLDVRRPEGGQQKFWVAGIPGAEIEYNARNFIPDMEIYLPALETGGDLRSWSEFTNDEIAVHFMESKGDDVFDRSNNFSLSASYKVSDATDFQFGISHTRRNKTKRAYITEESCAYCDFAFTFGQVGEVGIAPFPVNNYLSGISGSFPRMWPVINEDALLGMLQEAEQTIVNPKDGFLYEAGYSQLILPQLSNTRSYVIDENQSALYAMLDWQGEKIFVNAGARFIQTRVIASGATKDLQDLSPVTPARWDLEFSAEENVKRSTHYSKWLPSANIRYQISDKLLARISASKTMSRPSLSSLGPDVSWEVNSPKVLGIENGDVKLKPIESDQLDISLEHYNDQFYFAVSGFYKALKNIISRDEKRLTINDYEYSVSFPINASENDVYGVETSIYKAFDSGFGMQANLSVTESKEGFSSSLTGVSKYNYNIIGFYEKERLEIRFAYSYRDDYVSKGVGQSGLPQTTDEFKTLDLSGEYQFSENFSLFANVQNLLEEPSFEYSVERNRPLNYERLGYRGTVGVRFTF